MSVRVAAMVLGGLSLGACRFDIDRFGDDGAGLPFADGRLPADGSASADGAADAVAADLDGATLVTVDETLGGIADTFLDTERVNGAELVLEFAGPGYTQGERRALVRFELALPPGAQVVKGELHGVVADLLGEEVTIHRVTAPWREDQATWTLAMTGTAWAAGGGDHDPAVLDRFVPATADAPTPPIDLTPAVKDWAAEPAQNHGVLFRTTAASVGKLYSRESGTNGSPRLLVWYR